MNELNANYSDQPYIFLLVIEYLRSFAERINRLFGPGEPRDNGKICPTRSQMDPVLGADFDTIRVAKDDLKFSSS